jgi:hypothetical protein
VSIVEDEQPRNRWHFGIVQLYGCDLESPLRPFLDFTFQRMLQERPGTMLLCGGATQQALFPGKTEAGVACEYLTRRLAQEHQRWPEFEYRPVFIPKDRSFTTEENVRDACAYIQSVPGIDLHWDEVRVRAFCETSRSLKSMGFYWDFLPEVREHGQRVWMECLHWELQHPDSELAKANAAWLSRRFPLVGRILGGIRRLRAKHR